MIVIGLGTGRSGTASLANLVNSQADALCFHELNPSCVRFYNTPRPILNTIDEFQAIIDGGPTSDLTVDLGREVCAKAYDHLCTMPRVRMIGDIAFYYLSYVDRIVERNPNVRFVCLKRDRTETIDSWMKKSQLKMWPSKKIGTRISSLLTREPFRTSRNFWMDHDGTEWALDPVWDKCFPNFPGPTKREAIGQYWDFYYEESEKLAQTYPDVFRIVQTETLNTPEAQKNLLTFCGVPENEQIQADAHLHKSGRKSAQS